MNANVRLPLMILLGAVALVAAAAAQPDEAAGKRTDKHDVIDRYIAALGGREAIERLESRFCRGRLTDDLRSRPTPFYKEVDFEAYAAVPHRYRFDFHEEAFVERRGFDGRRGWIADSAGVRRDAEPIRTKIAFLLDPRSALNLEAYFPGLTYMGQRSLYGTTVHALQPADLKPEYYTLYFDVENGLLVGIGYHWEILDYRKVDGVLVPHHIVCGRKGGASTYDFLELRHNVAADDSLFEMPVPTE